MIRSHRMGAAALAAMALHGVALAGIPADTAQDLAHKSGLWTQLESLGTQVRAGMAGAMARGGAARSEADKTRMLDCGQAAFAADPLRKTAVDAVAGALQPADVTPLLAWYDSPLGRKIATVEQNSSTEVPDPQERLRRGTEALAHASADRKAALQAIVTETHSVEMMADTLIEMRMAVQQGALAASPNASAPSLSEIRAALGNARPQFLAHYAHISLPAYAFTYVNLSDAEVRQYADYLATPAATAFNDGTMRGVSRALTAASVGLGKCLKDVGGKATP